MNQAYRKLCRMPNCNQVASSVGRRGMRSITADNSKRSPWCGFHRKGGGREARIAFVRGKGASHEPV